MIHTHHTRPRESKGVNKMSLHNKNIKGYKTNKYIRTYLLTLLAQRTNTRLPLFSLRMYKRKIKKPWNNITYKTLSSKKWRGFRSEEPLAENNTTC